MTDADQDDPPTLYKISIILMVAVYFLFPQTRVIPFPANLAGVIFVLGVYMAISAKKLF